MSSWLSQANEVLLNQASFIPDTPEKEQKVSYTFKLTLATPTTIPPFTKMLTSKLWSSKQSSLQEPKLLSKEISVATAREKILVFGSSLYSQLPKTSSSATTSSPWNLFSHQSSPMTKQTLLRELISPKEFKTEHKETSQQPNPDSSNSASLNSYSSPLQTSLSFLQSPPHYLPKAIPQHQENQLKPKSLKENNQTQHSTKVKKEEILETKIAIKGQDKNPFPSNQDSDKKDHKQTWASQNKKEKRKVENVVPIIPAPTLGIFTLSYLLTKQGILSDFASYAYHKDSIDATQHELDMLHEERLTQIRHNIEKEERSRRWGSLANIVELISPFISIGVASAVILSGGGIFSFLALFAGLIELVIAIMTALEGWDALERILPIKHEKTRRRIVAGIHIGLHLLALGLSLSSLYLEKIGLSALLEGSLKGLIPALEAIAGIVRGGSLWIKSELEGLKAKFSLIEAQIELINMERDDNFIHSQDLLDNIESSFEYLMRLLTFIRELDQDHLQALKS